MTSAYLATLVVLVIPGAVVARLLRLPLRSLATWAAIPVLSLATTFVIAEITLVTGLPFDLLTASIVIGALTALVVALRRAKRDESNERSEPAKVPNRALAETIGLALLGLGIAIGLFTWARGISGHGLVPPNSDAAYHGFFIARILETHSIDVAKVAITDPAGRFHVVSYYPFGMHASAALAAQLTGASIGRMLVAFTVVFSAVILPLGMFVLAKMLAPESPLIAGFTALLVPSVALFPYGPVQFGDIPIVVGMALVPISVVLVVEALGRDASAPIRPTGRTLAGGLAVLAAISVHSSQLPLIVALVALLVVERSLRAHSGQIFGRAVVHGLMVSAVAVVLFIPSLRAFASGVSERSGFDNTPVRPFHDVLGSVMGLDPGAFGHPTRQVVLAVVAGFGVAIWLLRRRFAWVFGYILVVLIMLLAATSDSGLSKLLSLPWYRGPGRIGWNRGVFVPFFAAVALAWVVMRIVRFFRNSRRSLLVATATVVAVACASIGYQGFETSSAMLRYSFSHDALVTPESEQAFAWLAHHSDPHDTIINNITPLGLTADDSVWMYATQGLRPLFGFGQSTVSGFELPTVATRRDLRDRTFLLTHLDLLGRNRTVDHLFRQYRTRWIYFDTRSLTNYRHTLDLAELERNPHLRLAFHRGQVYVFEIKL